MGKSDRVCNKEIPHKAERGSRIPAFDAERMQPLRERDDWREGHRANVELYGGAGQNTFGMQISYDSLR